MGIEMMLERIMGAMEKQVRKGALWMRAEAAILPAAISGSSQNEYTGAKASLIQVYRIKNCSSCEKNAQTFELQTGAWRSCSRTLLYAITPFCLGTTNHQSQAV